MNLRDALRAARREGRTAVVPYLVVDRQRAGRLGPTVTALKRAGATALELGFPFSDPIADGPVLEAASGLALRHGTVWKDLLRACHTASKILPTAVMTYANPVWSRRLDTAMKELRTAGATGLVVPDLSLEESLAWRGSARRSGVALVLLAAPGISVERIRRIARASRGFLYLVSRYGTTGASAAGSSVDLSPLVDAAHGEVPGLPVLLGFGVRDRATARRAEATGADGWVVGTALEERLQHDPRPEAICRWLRGIVGPQLLPTDPRNLGPSRLLKRRFDESRADALQRKKADLRVRMNRSD